MKKILLTAVFLTFAISVFAGMPYNNFWFQVRDEYGNPVDDFTSVEVYDGGTFSAEGSSDSATIYSTARGGLKVNPILLATTSNGIVMFWSDQSTVDVLVQKTARSSVLFSGLTTAQHTIYMFEEVSRMQGETHHQRWVDAPTSDSTSVLTEDRIDSLTGSGTSVNTNLIYPTNLNIVCYRGYQTDSTWKGYVGVYGELWGTTVYESVSMDVDNDTVCSAFTTQLFDFVSAIVVDSAMANTAAYADTITAGPGTRLLLDRRPYGNTATRAIEAGAYVAGTSVTIGGSADRGFYYIPVTAADASNDYELWFNTYNLLLRGD